MNSRLNIKRLTLAILLMGLAVIVVWSWVQGKWGLGTDIAATAPPAATQRVAVVNGVTMVTLDTATQAESGIRTEPLSGANDRAEIAAYGTVLDLQPLIDLRARYDAARAEADAALAMVAASRQEYERSRVLYQHNQNIS